MMNKILSRDLLCIIAVTLLANASIPLKRERRAVAWSFNSPWPKGVIPYKVDSSFAPEELKELEFAIQTWNKETCVQFRPYSEDDKSWIHIQDGSACEAETGYGGYEGSHDVTLAKIGCRYYGWYLHELGHALGLRHEHTRPNRDDYIKVNLDAILGGSKLVFEKKEAKDFITYDSPYDLQSVMHYGPHSLIFDLAKPSIEVKDPKNKDLLRDVAANVLSFWDAMVVNRHYKCEEKCTGTRTDCPKPGFIDQHCQCQTPSNFAQRCCVDILENDECRKLSDNGDCQKRVSYMAINCRKTCNICFKHVATQLAESCSDKMSEDFCQNQKSMCTEDSTKAVCPKTCGVCTSEETKGIPKPTQIFQECISGDPRGCPGHRSDCHDVETYRRCPNVCKNCGPCEDTLSNCPSLKEKDNCRLSGTVQDCRKTCGACGP